MKKKEMGRRGKKRGASRETTKGYVLRYGRTSDKTVSEEATSCSRPVERSSVEQGDLFQPPQPTITIKPNVRHDHIGEGEEEAQDETNAKEESSW